MNKTIVGISAAAMALGLGFGATTLATAEETPEPTPGVITEAPRGFGQYGQRGGGKGMRGMDTARLAERLGVDESSIDEALEEIRAERHAAFRAEQQQVLEQAVADGKLTQSEADAVQKAIDQGIVGLRGVGPRR